MKLTILFILIFVFTTFGQSGENAQTAAPVTLDQMEIRVKSLINNKRFAVKHDRFKNLTRVQFGWAGIDGHNKGRLQMAAAFQFEGDTLTESADTFIIWFHSVGLDWKYIRNNRLIFLAGNERIDLGDAQHEGEVDRPSTYSRYSRVWVNETMAYKLNRSQVEKIVGATNVEFQLGGFTATLNSEARVGLYHLFEMSKP
jgi:hypothetical protein